MRQTFPEISNPEGFASLAKEFVAWSRVELGFAKETVEKYEECLLQVWRFWSEREIGAYTASDMLRLKENFINRGLGVSRQTSLLLALKRFLLFCQTPKGLALQIEPETIKPPRRPRREVSFLTPAEVEQFVSSIQLITSRGEPHKAGLRLRALVEMLLGSAMRISELLSLNRGGVDFQAREAVVIGKGNKQRTVFFTARALHWADKYLAIRDDNCEALFVCQDGATRLKRDDLWRYFHHYRIASGLRKNVSPHILRHTAATQLLFNGCPVGHIKEILGHERLETTCRYYLGLDRRAAKAAHSKYLNYDA